MQRRLASSARAIRRTLERRLGRVDEALADPEAYLAKQLSRAASARTPSVGDVEDDDIEDLTEEERWRLEEQAILNSLPATVFEREADAPSLSRSSPRQSLLTRRAQRQRLNELLDVVNALGLRDDRSKKLLIFTEHKDTLDFLVEKLSARLRRRSSTAG